MATAPGGGGGGAPKPGGGGAPNPGAGGADGTVGGGVEPCPGGGGGGGIAMLKVCHVAPCRVGDHGGRISGRVGRDGPEPDVTTSGH